MWCYLNQCRLRITALVIFITMNIYIGFSVWWTKSSRSAHLAHKNHHLNIFARPPIANLFQGPKNQFIDAFLHPIKLRTPNIHFNAGTSALGDFAVFLAFSKASHNRIMMECSRTTLSFEETTYPVAAPWLALGISGSSPTPLSPRSHLLIGHILVPFYIRRNHYEDSTATTHNRRPTLPRTPTTSRHAKFHYTFRIVINLRWLSTSLHPTKRLGFN